jgi:hypothetical protein
MAPFAKTAKIRPKAQAEQERLAKALKANLARRKAGPAAKK